MCVPSTVIANILIFEYLYCLAGGYAGTVFVFYLHAAMAAACRCLENGDHFSAFKPTSRPQLQRGIPRLPDLLSPSARQKKRKNKNKGKLHSEWPALLPSPQRGTKLHLDLHPFLHRRGLRSRVIARSPDPRARWCCDLSSRCSCFSDPARRGQIVGAPLVWVDEVVCV